MTVTVSPRATGRSRRCPHGGCSAEEEDSSRGNKGPKRGPLCVRQSKLRVRYSMVRSRCCSTCIRTLSHPRAFPRADRSSGRDHDRAIGERTARKLSRNEKYGKTRCPSIQRAPERSNLPHVSSPIQLDRKSS